jgi:GDP-mannose 6-dehydrogenase
LSRDGHEVTGVDIDDKKLNLLRSGTTPIIEDRMPELIHDAANSGRLSLTKDVSEAIRESVVSFICVGTPSTSKGDHDLSALRAVLSEIGEAIGDKDSAHVVVVRSTVAPGTTRKIVIPLLEQRSRKKCGEDFKVCFQPEFLREGASVKDYDNPPFTVVGCDNSEDAGELEELFGHLNCQFVRTSYENAEMLKFCCNVFHALKIGFANEVGRICAGLDMDSRMVMDLLCMDRQLNISTAYLRPGMAFGGSCLPKDVRAMMHMSQESAVSTPVISSIMPSNRDHKDYLANKLLASGKRKVGLLGLSFKSGTDDLRESPLVDLVEHLLGKGLEVRIFDPEVHIASLFGANKRYIEKAIPHISRLMEAELEDVISWAEIVAVGQVDSEGLGKLKSTLNSEQHLIDMIGTLQQSDIPCSYEGILW